MAESHKQSPAERFYRGSIPLLGSILLFRCLLQVHTRVGFGFWFGRAKVLLLLEGDLI